MNIKLKPSSLLMKFFALFMGGSFMTDYCTTICNTIYIPSASFVIAAPQLLAHETVHIYQRAKNVFYLLMYLTFWRKSFEAQAYSVQAWYKNQLDGTDIQTYYQELSDKYFTAFGVYCFLTGKKPAYQEPTDELKVFVVSQMKIWQGNV